MSHTPALQQIIDQVEANIIRMIKADETGEVTIYIGRHQLQVESRANRKQEPVRIERGPVSVAKRVSK